MIYIRYTDEQKKKNMLAKMVRRRLVGGKYKPKEEVKSGIPRHEWGNTDELLKELRKGGYIELHKGGKCVSINPRNKNKVKEYLKGEVPEYLWDNF